MKKTFIEVNKWNAQKIIQTMESGKFDSSYIETGLDWYRLSRYGSIPEEIIDKYNGFWDWTQICGYQTLSEKFIRDHMDYIGKSAMMALCARQVLSVEFIADYMDQINWLALSRNPNLTDDIKEKFHDKLAAYLGKSLIELVEDGVKS